MMLLALFAAAVLVDDTFRIPRGEWSFVEFEIKESGSVVRARFTSDPGRVRLYLATSAAVRQFRTSSLASTDWEESGRFRHAPAAAGPYAVVVESDPEAAQFATVRLKVELDPPPAARGIDPVRRAWIVSGSLAALAVAAYFAVRRLCCGSSEGSPTV
ncbi:MAG: hypothetical protein ACRD96_00805 [Bryobacteraceae bacterium]